MVVAGYGNYNERNLACLGGPVLTLVIFALACSSQHKLTDSAMSANNSDFDAGNGGLQPLNGSVLFTMAERPWDLALHPNGSIYCSAQTGGKVYYWDTEEQEVHEIPRFFEGLVAIDFDDEQLIYTSTADTNTGALNRFDFETNELIEMSTQSDDGILMRWPIDIAAGPDESWFVADYNAQTVFQVTPTGTRTISTGSSKPTSVLFIDDTLYTGGDDGIFEWNVTSEAHGQIDTRPAAALQIINGTLIASGNPNAVFVVNGEPIGFEGPARHGSMVYNGEQLFLTDRIGEGVWVATP